MAATTVRSSELVVKLISREEIAVWKSAMLLLFLSNAGSQPRM